MHFQLKANCVAYFQAHKAMLTIKVGTPVGCWPRGRGLAKRFSIYQGNIIFLFVFVCGISIIGNSYINHY